MHTHERRAEAAADANPQAFAAWVRQYLGVPAPAAARLLDLHGKLHRGGGLSQDDVAFIAHTYADQATAAEVRHLADDLHSCTAPGPHRARAFLALLADDVAVANDQLHDAGQAYRKLDKLAQAYHTESMSEAINAKREATTPRDRRHEVQRPAADPLSTRELIERQLEPPGARYLAERVNAGDPDAAVLVGNAMADKVEEASARLRPETDISTRDALGAAWDIAQAREVAADQGWIEQEDA